MNDECYEYMNHVNKYVEYMRMYYNIIVILSIIVILLFILVYSVFIFATDIDECAVLNGGCEHSCHNIIGSYFCSCNEGFELASNSHDCPGKPY